MNSWYYRLVGTEFGPVTFEELVSLAKEGTLSREDEVRLSDSTIWRRAGSMGQLMAHFPFETEKRVIQARSAGVKKNVRVDARSHVSQHSASVKPAVADETSPSNDQEVFWCLIQGKEYGPVERPRLLEWAASGRLVRSDHVRVGRAAYVLAKDFVPSLFPKLPEPIANETKVELSAVTETRAMNVPKPTVSYSPQALSSVDDQRTIEAPKPTLSNYVPMPTPVASNYSTGYAATNRPKFQVQRPALKKANSGSFKDSLTSKPVMAVGGTLLFGVLAFFFVPGISLGDSANVKRFKELKGAYYELARLRNSDNVSAESFPSMNEKIETIAKKVALELKDGKDPVQRKILSLATKMEELSKEKLGPQPSESEAVVSKAIADTGKKLGIL